MFNSLAEFRAYVDRYYVQGAWKGFLRGSGSLLNKPLDQVVKDFYCQGLTHRTSFFSSELEGTFKKLLPFLQSRNDQGLTSRVLSIPCSRGQEVYSLAVLADQAGIKNVEVEGKDVCYHQIEIASNQEYWVEQERKDRLQPYLEQGYFWVQHRKRKRDNFPNLRISPNITSRCSFQQLDVLLEEIPADYQAVICLNLFMHLSPAGRERALENLTANLQNGTLLFLGESYSVNLGYQKGWNVERDRRSGYNRFIEGLEERPELRLRRINQPNVYLKE
jgi:chemotaxis methyl-accepting protein methylase